MITAPTSSRAMISQEKLSQIQGSEGSCSSSYVKEKSKDSPSPQSANKKSGKVDCSYFYSSSLIFLFEKLIPCIEDRLAYCSSTLMQIFLNQQAG